MTDNASAPRSRRALLAAAAGGAAALAASAALPLTALAPTAIPRRRTGQSTTRHRRRPAINELRRPNTTPSRQPRPGPVSASRASSTGGAGIVGWSISAPARSIRWMAAYTGIFGWSPAAPIENQTGVGVVGVSDDWGVFGNGTVGVYGYGTYGVVGESQSTAAGVTAFGLERRPTSLSTSSARSASADPVERRSPRASRPRPSIWPGSPAAAGSSPSSTAIEAVARSGPSFPPPAASRSTSTPRCRRRHTWPGSC